jgi:hypothetical protein
MRINSLELLEWSISWAPGCHCIPGTLHSIALTIAH